MSAIQEQHRPELDAKRYPALETLRPQEILELSEGAQVLEFATDVPIMTEGQQPEALYFVQSGKLEVNKRHNNHVHEVGEISAGDIFGEASILYGTPANSEVRTKTPASLIKARKAPACKLLEENGSFRNALLQLAEQRAAANALVINSILSALPLAIREILILNAQYISLAPNEVLFSESNGDSGTMYLITSGKAETSVQHPSIAGQKMVLGRYFAGDILGDESCIKDKQYIATATAISDLHLMTIDSNAPGIWGKRFPDLKKAAEEDFRHKQDLFKKTVERPMSFAGDT